MTRVGIGVDVGGTTIKFGVIDEEGRVIERTDRPTRAEEGPDRVLAEVSDGINALLTDHSHVSAIGIGFPGSVNRSNQICYPPNFPGWEVVDPLPLISERLTRPLPIVIENDANVAAWAEAQIGGGRGEPHFLYVTLGTGVGGCIISDGAIWRGATGAAGEIGHMTVDVNGPICNCGARGCVEAYIGSRYMTEYAEQKMRRYRESRLHAMLMAGRELTPHLINQAAEDGDIFAQNFLSDLGRILGAALASAMNACDLHLCIVGGGVAQAEMFLLGQARRTLRARVLQSIAADVQLRVATLSTNAGIVGAALLGLAERHGGVE